MTLSNTIVGSIELDEDSLRDLGLDLEDFPTSANGDPLFIPGNVAWGDGGGILNLGAIGDPVTDELDGIGSGSIIAFNEAKGSLGGGIYNAGSLEISDSEVADNFFGGFGDGGGIYLTLDHPLTGQPVDGPVTAILDTATIRDNRSRRGGGIFVDSGTTLEATNSTFSGNSALGDSIANGGAISNIGTILVTSSTFHDNEAHQNAGALWGNAGASSTLINVTMSGNRANVGGGEGNLQRR